MKTKVCSCCGSVRRPNDEDDDPNDDFCQCEPDDDGTLPELEEIGPEFYHDDGYDAEEDDS